MPLTRGAVTFSRFRVRPGAKELPSDLPRSLGRALRARAFEPLDRTGDEERAAGFVELEAEDGVEFASGSVFRGDHALFAYRVDTLKVPSSPLQGELTKRLEALEAENDRHPARGEMPPAEPQLR